jgi:hypothetical protein
MIPNENIATATIEKERERDREKEEREMLLLHRTQFLLCPYPKYKAADPAREER